MPADDSSRQNDSTLRCLNCGAVVTAAYCSNCGQDNRERRLTGRRVLRKSVEEVAELETPLLRTLVDLSWRPGWVAREYVRGRRRAFVNPLKYCLIMAALATLMMKVVGFDLYQLTLDTNPQLEEESNPALLEANARLSTWFMEYVGLVIAVTLPILALLLRAAFWRSRFNWVEYYVMSLFAYGQVFLIQALLIPTGAYAHPIFGIFYNLMPIIWLTLAAAQFCECRRWYAVLMSLLAHAAYFVILTVLLLAGALVYVLMTDPAALN